MTNKEAIDRFRRIALGLPGAAEGSHAGAVDFRVNHRIFVTLAYAARNQAHSNSPLASRPTSLQSEATSLKPFMAVGAAWA